MNKDLRIINYLRDREQGLFFSYRRRQLSVQQTLVTNNECKSEPLRDGYPSTSFNTKAFLIVMSVDKSFFAVATSENSVGVYCSISGELVYKLIGSQCPIYTISWHPHFSSIIGCSNVSGSVFVWDICNSHEKECNYQKIWSWPPLSSITYAIGFHPFQSIMALARDREIRFIDWEKGVHIGQWRFNGEFSLVAWMSWSFVGSSVISAVGNPPRDGLLASIIAAIDFDARAMSSPMQSGCSHYNNNYLCEVCDTCDKMSTLDTGPPKFEEYRVNAVDLIRYVLSRPPEWFVAIFVCVDCRLRFKLWADSIQIHNKYDLEANLTKQKVQLPHDVESANVTVMESPMAPELVWDLFQQLDTTAGVGDKRLQTFRLPKSDVALWEQSRSLLRCAAMFERECLRQSICWCCIQQLHYWLLQQDDLPLFLYEAMVQVRQMVIERVKNYDTNIFKMDCKENEKYEKETLLSVISDGHTEPTRETPVKDGSLDNNPLIQPDLCHDNVQPQEHCVISDDIHSRNHSEYNGLAFSISDLYPRSLETNLNLENDRRKRLEYLHVTLKFLQLYVSEPSKLGDLVNTFMDNNLSQSGMLFGPSINQSKVDSYSVRKWHLEPLGAGTSPKIFPRHNLTESHLVVPCLTLSGTGLTESSIRISKCGRMIAVFVPHDSFGRIHAKELPNNNNLTRKRQYSKAFKDTILTDCPISKDPVIAIYASEPESSCGQLLYYFEMPYNAISLDFSPLGDHLIVGLPGSQNQSYLFWINSEFAPHSNWSFTGGPPSDNQFNIGLILNINPTGNDPTVRYHSVTLKGPRRMQLVQIINHTRGIIRNGLSDLVGLDDPLNCVVWNTAGGIIYSKEPGTLFSLSFVGGKA